MNVTREVMKDLLPVYFSGEASEDTRRLVEEYFRDNPQFERMARSAARPLETLRGAAPIAPDAEKEKRDLECMHHEMRRNKVLFGLAAFFTLAPLAFVYHNGHLVWMMVRNAPWDAGFYWAWAALLWVFYFRRLRRMLYLIAAVFFTLFPFLSHLAFSGGAPAYIKGLPDWTSAFLWGAAALFWVQYFARLRRRTAALLFAIFLTVFPFPFMLYHVFGGGPLVTSSWGDPAFFWTFGAFMWLHYLRLRRKADADEEC